jgi:hypothetical protein
MGRNGPAESAPAVLNGELAPKFSLRAGARHRIRFVNITPDDVFEVSLQGSNGRVAWQPITKDGAPVPPAQSSPTAARQIVSSGETYDFAYDAPPGRRTLWMEIRSPGGKWQGRGGYSSSEPESPKRFSR